MTKIGKKAYNTKTEEIKIIHSINSDDWIGVKLEYRFFASSDPSNYTVHQIDEHWHKSDILIILSMPSLKTLYTDSLNPE